MITRPELEKLIAGSTPPKWWFNSYSTIFAGSGEDAVVIAYLPVVAGDTATRQGTVDAALIAAAPTIAADLLAAMGEVERLRGLLADARDVVRDFATGETVLLAAIDAALSTTTNSEE